MPSKLIYLLSFARQQFISGLLLGIAVSVSRPAFSQQLAVALSESEACNSYIRISGKSNVNQFNFIYNTQQHSEIKSSKKAKDTGRFEIIIPIKDFEASNPLMYDDFLKLMKASVYPEIKIGIPDDQLFILERESPSLCPEMQITIAGITRKYKIDCLLTTCSDNVFLIGSQKIKLSDFNLEPPEKLYGMVKVENEIKVNFSFIITFTDTKLISELF